MVHDCGVVRRVAHGTFAGTVCQESQPCDGASDQQFLHLVSMVSDFMHRIIPGLCRSVALFDQIVTVS